ncbi:MAG: hypothetical protein E7565_06710 [Ruminococcaceae bacterium]|nr:hypothetical protein [Oscillospiraceae bacterium]
MKRIVSIILSLLLIMSMVMSLPFNVSAITIEEIDKENTELNQADVFDFEDADAVKVGVQSLSDSKVTYKVDDENTLEYYYSGWGFSRIANNPAKTATSGEGSIVNSSDKVLGAAKTTVNTWSTGGGWVLNNQTALGVKPYVLEGYTTYTVEFDYFVKSTNTVGGTSKDVLSIGYGYKENTDTDLAAVSGFNTNIATVATYNPSVNLDGTFTAFDGVKEVGNWYHFSATFKTGSLESIYSVKNAPFLILCANMYTGASFFVDNIKIGKTPTNSAFFDYENKEYMYVTSQSHSSKKCEWQVDPVNRIDYYISGWGFGGIADNPVRNDTGVSGSITNPSAKALQARKTAYNGWTTSGGLVINRKTENGIEPVVLEDNTTYTVEFDYIVNSNHIYGDWIDPNDGTKSGTISTSATSSMTFGYGYRISTSTGLAPVNTPKTTVATIASYKAERDADGTFTDGGNTTRQVGSWYHQSHTFTTGTFDSIYSAHTTEDSKPTNSNAPFLIFYASQWTGAWFMVDNIRIIKHVELGFNANGGTVSTTSFEGVMGDTITLPTPTRMGYDFTGWYKDGACTVPFTDRYLSKENAGTTIYAGWKMGIEGFENYVGTGKNSKFESSNLQAYIGAKSIKYSWTYSWLGTGRTSNNSYFPIFTLENNGETSATYKLTFRYYIGSVDMKVQPALAKNASNSTDISKLGSAITLSSSGQGRWQTVSMVFTVTNSKLSTYPILALHAYANSNTTTTTYFDDFEITPVKSGTATGSLTVSGTSVGMVNGDVIDNGFVYNDGYAVEGWYSDSALTDKIAANVYKTETTAAYPKFSDRVDLTANGTRTRTGDFAKVGYNDSLVYSGATGSGTASLANAAAGSYMVEFLYKNKGGNDVTATVGSDSFVMKRSKADDWNKGFIPVTTTSAGVLELSLSGKAPIEIKDVYIKNLSGKVYVLFDSTEFGGEITCVYGAAGTDLTFAEAPIVEGKQFSGWYNGSEKFTSTSFPISSVSLKAQMGEAGETVKGDCDGDGVCNTTDLAKMKLYLAKIDSKIADGADMNGDSKVNAIDLVLLYNALVGN